MAKIITIDKTGRLVIPAPVRRKLALTGGMELEIHVEGDTIHLRPVSGASLERRGRRLVVSSPLSGEVPDHRGLRDERTDRLTGEDD